MRKSMKLLFFSLLFMFLLGGCSANDPNINQDLFQYKDSLVGDNSAVGNIVHELPGSDQLDGFELKTKEEPYGIILNYDWIEPETVIYNATLLFALVKNVDWITFHSNNAENTITKEDLQLSYGKEISDFENEEELKELIQDFVEDENKVEQILK